MEKTGDKMKSKTDKVRRKLLKRLRKKTKDVEKWPEHMKRMLDYREKEHWREPDNYSYWPGDEPKYIWH